MLGVGRQRSVQSGSRRPRRKCSETEAKRPSASFIPFCRQDLRLARQRTTDTLFLTADPQLVARAGPLNETSVELLKFQNDWNHIATENLRYTDTHTRPRGERVLIADATLSLDCWEPGEAHSADRDYERYWLFALRTRSLADSHAWLFSKRGGTACKRSTQM